MMRVQETVMTMDEIIKEKILAGLNPSHMELVNESRHHQGHAGDDGTGETHYNLLVVSDCFSGLSRVQRQRLVYGVLKEPIIKGIHAISLKCMTDQEYNF